MEKTMLRIMLLTGVMILAGRLWAVEPDEAARVQPKEEWVAGSTGSIEVVYTVGRDPIAVGGSIGLSFKHALVINLSTQPGRAGYVKVLRASGEALPVRVVEWPAQTVFEYPPAPAGGSQAPTGASDLRAGIRYSVFADVVNARIEPGEDVRFVLGADAAGMIVPPNVCENPMRVVVDPDGDGKYRISECVPSFRIVAGAVDHLHVTMPPTRNVGDLADVCIRAEDRLNCVAATCNAEIALSGMPGFRDAAVTLVSGLGKVEAKVARSGVWRVTATGAGMSAVSNPMVVARKQAWQVYWGDLHVHTTCSDALGGDPDYAYTYARDAADLDVCALGDHGPRELSRLATRKYNQDGRFVTIWGYEWAESEPGRLDRNIYFHNEDDPIPAGWPRRIEDFWKSLEKVYGDNAEHRVIVGPHMFTYKTKARPWFETWDDRYDRFAEIYSEHGASEYYGNPRMLAGGNVQEGYFAQDGLAHGRKFGFIGSSDTHDTRAGRGSNSLACRGGLVAFVAKDLSRASIWDAFWNRRVYAATNDRIYIEFQIDGHAMGEAFETRGHPGIKYAVYGCDDGFSVVLLKNNKELRKTTARKGAVREAFTDKAFDADSHYYVRVVQANGEHAWSSPIWVGAQK